MKLRSFRSSDATQVQALFQATFTEAENEQEGALIGRLVAELAGQAHTKDVFGFLACDEDEIVGGIFFSRLTFSQPLEAFILSPVAVSSKHQGQGIGQKLISFGLQALAERGVEFVMTYGDPAFYSRVGFQPISVEEVEPPHELSQPEGWIGQNLTGGVLDMNLGSCACVAALDDPAYW